MSGIAYEIVPESEAPDELQPGVSRYVEQADGTILQYIGDEDGIPVLMSGRSQTLFAAEVNVFKNSSNSQTVFCDALGLSALEYHYVEPDYYVCRIGFSNNAPNGAKAKGEAQMLSKWGAAGRDFSRRYVQRYDDNSPYDDGGELEIWAYEAGTDSLIVDPGEFHAYVKILQF